MKRSFRLVICDNSSNKEIYHGVCWNICQYSNPTNLCEVKFKTAAKDNYLLVGRVHNCVCGRDDSSIFDTFLCAKVDSIGKTCKVRKTSAGLDVVLLAKTLLDESDLDKKKTLQERIGSIVSSSLHFLGFAFDSAVLCQTKFNYRGENFTYFGAKTVFSLDLDEILDTYEPCSLFSAVHFPLEQNMFHSFQYKRSHADPSLIVTIAKGPEPEYYPHFQTTEKGGVKLTGIVEITAATENGVAYDYYCHDEGKINYIPKIHSFQKSFEIKDLEEEDDYLQPSKSKRTKLNQN